MAVEDQKLVPPGKKSSKANFDIIGSGIFGRITYPNPLESHFGGKCYPMTSFYPMKSGQPVFFGHHISTIYLR